MFGAFWMELFYHQQNIVTHHRSHSPLQNPFPVLPSTTDSKPLPLSNPSLPQVSTTLVRLIKDSERTAATQPVVHRGELVVKEASELLRIIARSARLLECLTFSVGSFYSQVQEGTIDELLRSTASLPRYISSRLSTRFGVSSVLQTVHQIWSV